MTKGIRFLGKDKEGKDIIEYYKVPDVEPIKLTPEDYDRRVSELIHERYTYDQEAAMAAKHRRCTIGLCSEIEKKQLMDEAIEFENYRDQCKIQAREECGII